jgi:pyruvate formate lyase activating enzyme
LSFVCDVCPRACNLKEGQAGFCGVRTNIGGENKDRFYGLALLDYEPAGNRECVTLPGCNLLCPTCLYPPHSQAGTNATYLTQFSPINEEAIVAAATRDKVPFVTFSGGEPTLHYEYLLRVAQQCKDQGIYTGIQTNGYISDSMAQTIARAVDYVYVGIKGAASPQYYARMDADPSIVMKSCQIFWENTRRGVFLGYLVDPSFGATRQDDEAFAKWVCQNLSATVPVCLEYLFPPSMEIMKEPLLPPDPEETWRFLREVAGVLVRNGLTNVQVIDIPRVMKTGARVLVPYRDPSRLEPFRMADLLR